MITKLELHFQGNSQEPVSHYTSVSFQIPQGTLACNASYSAPVFLLRQTFSLLTACPHTSGFAALPALLMVLAERKPKYNLKNGATKIKYPDL